MLWFNLPYNCKVKTNIGRIFLKLVDKYFESSPKLRKIFNRNNIKVSYGYVKKIEKLISHHNNKLVDIIIF